MKFLILFVVLIYKKTRSLENDEVTESIDQRVQLLKKQLLKEIEIEQQISVPGLKSHKENSGEIDPHLDYKSSSEDGPIIPIMDFDERKFKDKYKFKPLVSKYTTPAETMTSAEAETVTSLEEEITEKPLRSRTDKKQDNNPANVPAEIFYRRWEGRDEAHDEPVKGLHCLSFITPYWFEGKGTDGDQMRPVLATDNLVLRLIHLLSQDTKAETKDGIYSILVQISNLPLRIYQWQDEAVQLLINAIIHGREQNFRTLKRGIKKLFEKWHLDITNTTNLLEQTRIIRPPCIQTSELTGSTKTTYVQRFTKAKDRKRTCPESEENSCEEP